MTNLKKTNKRPEAELIILVMCTTEIEWGKLSTEEKKYMLFIKQKRTLDLFLERNAISEAQYDKSLSDLRNKMGIKEGLH